MLAFQQKRILSLLTKILVDYFRKCLDNPMIHEILLDLFRIYLEIQMSKYIFHKVYIHITTAVNVIPTP